MVLYEVTANFPDLLARYSYCCQQAGLPLPAIKLHVRKEAVQLWHFICLLVLSLLYCLVLT